MARISKSLSAALTKDLPVLFVYIGWAKFYDGTEEIVGNHRGLNTTVQDGLTSGEALLKTLDLGRVWQ